MILWNRNTIILNPQKQICDQLGFTDRTIRRCRDDIKMDSAYRKNIHKKKKLKQSPDTKTENVSKNENTKSVIDESSKNKIIEKRIKNRQTDSKMI